MVGLLLYGYCRGVFSSRKLERASHEDIGFRVLCGGTHPDHSAICSFRQRFSEQLSELFLQVLRLCQEAGLVKLGHVALDGTKVAANANKHKANSYDRMKQREQELQAEITGLMDEAEKVDAAEDAKYGQGKRGDELPAELHRREERLKKIRAAKEALEAEAARAHAEHKAKLAKESAEAAAQADEASSPRAEAKAARAEELAVRRAAKAVAKAEKRLEHCTEEAAQLVDSAKTRSERSKAASAEKAREAAQQELERAEHLCSGGDARDASTTLPEHHVPFDRNGDPKPSAQRNYTDPDSRIMKTGDGFIQGYNCQAAVDAEHQIIVAQAATNQAPDQEHLPPMLNAVIDNCGQVPDAFSADAGYWAEGNAIQCEDAGCDAYIATGRQKHGQVADDPGGDPDPNAKREEMRTKLRTPEGKSEYARRKAVVEPVFGQIKEAQGYRRFLRRGIEMVRAEWSLVCTAHNLLKLLRARTAVPQGAG
jgi:hypothetical protein